MGGRPSGRRVNVTRRLCAVRVVIVGILPGYSTPWCLIDDCRFVQIKRDREILSVICSLRHEAGTSIFIPGAIGLILFRGAFEMMTPRFLGIMIEEERYETGQSLI